MTGFLQTTNSLRKSTYYLQASPERGDGCIIGAVKGTPRQDLRIYGEYLITSTVKKKHWK